MEKNMIEPFKLTLRFQTPAFLGDTEQNGAWRTPPIKALLRQFWRMDYARRAGWNVNLDAMRRDEGVLFGQAGDQKNPNQSRIRIRLDPALSRNGVLEPVWQQGKLTSWNGLEQPPISHPDRKQRTSPHSYLGFGPLDARGGTRFGEKCHAAIQAEEHAALRIGVIPARHSDDVAYVRQTASIQAALALANRFGALGGRSRNGWGSFSLTADSNARSIAVSVSEMPLRDWRDALELDWPHALGMDEGEPLIWTTNPDQDWKCVMRSLAEVRLDLRTQFRIGGRDAVSSPSDGHWLAYPVKEHSVAAWKDKNGDFRLPNSLRFKVVPAADGKLRGLIFHMPHLPPKAFRPDRRNIERVWVRVHSILNNNGQLHRLGMEDLV